MAIFQCVDCGCAEHTGLGWYAVRFFEDINGPETLGKALCSACAPKKYPNGELTRYTGKWREKFERHYFPLGEMFTNRVGNLEHRQTGLTGREILERFAKDCPYPGAK